MVESSVIELQQKISIYTFSRCEKKLEKKNIFFIFEVIQEGLIRNVKKFHYTINF